MTTLSNIFSQSLQGALGIGLNVYSTINELPLSGNDIGKQAFVTNTNRLYIWNGVGWFNIALINTNPTITQGPNPSYMLSRDGTPTVITLLAADPEGIPITWNQQVTGGTLGNIATITQNNNVFTITPSTNENNVGTFSVTFTASDGVNIATAASSFTLVFAAKDVLYNQSVVLNTTATNAGTNNVFVDSSSNNATVTRNGNTTQGSFSPYSPAGWSAFFDGTGDYLSSTVGTTLDVLADTDFTVEGWCFLTARPATRPAIFSNYNSFTTGGLSFWAGHGSSTTTQFQVGINGTFPALNAGTIPYNSWFHWAIVRNGTGSNNITVYINGTSIGTISSNVAITTTGNNLWLGASGDAVANAGINGYMSNFRWVTGTAVYTTNFTPPTDPLTAVAGTRFLTLQDNRFVDRSTNNFAITRIGNARIEPFSPFLPTTIYTTAAHGGSAYFDGTGDFLRLGNDVDNFSGDVTVECWVYPEAVGTGARQWLFGSSVNGAGIHGVNIASASGALEVWLGSYSAVARTSTIPVVAGAWNHIALVRAGGVISLYVNGVSAMTTATMAQWGRGSVLGIGEYAGEGVQFFRGFMSGYRYITGTALYTANFVPPTAPATPIANTYRQLNFTNSNIFDETGKVVFETVGDAQVTTSVVRYGDGSVTFDGTGDYLLSPSDPVFDFPGNFTIEMWANFVNVNSTWQSIISRAYGVAGGWRLYKNDGNNQLRWYSNLTSVVLTTGSTLANNTWHHIAVVRNSGTVTIFIDGVNRGSAANATAYTPGNYALEIGQGVVTSTFPMNGRISDLRITNGRARYTANFTPPTQKLGYNNIE